LNAGSPLWATIDSNLPETAIIARSPAELTLGGRNFRLTSSTTSSVAVTTVRLELSSGTGQTGYRLDRMTEAGIVAVAPNLAPGATSFTDVLGGTVQVACYQLAILGASNNVIGRSEILCAVFNVAGVAGGPALPRNISITTNDSPQITLTWEPPSVDGQLGYLVVPLGRPALPFVPAHGVQAIDTPAGGTCYLALTIIPTGGSVPIGVGGFSDVVCGIPRGPGTAPR
jgi:hypothetical protein